jgi:hypothetical protein
MAYNPLIISTRECSKMQLLQDAGRTVSFISVKAFFFDFSGFFSFAFYNPVLCTGDKYV